MEGGPLSSKALGGWFNRSILNGSEMPLVKEHILIQSVLPNLEGHGSRQSPSKEEP
jgi:hypothetical protein